jgi:hypothetical protein
VEPRAFRHNLVAALNADITCNQLNLRDVHGSSQHLRCSGGNAVNSYAPAVTALTGTVLTGTALTGTALTGTALTGTG